MRKKLINLHWEWMEAGSLPTDGLCKALEKTKYIHTIEKVIEEYGEQGTYWGADIKRDDNDISDYYNFKRYREYGPTRQAIVLLICAMHNEL